jgi:hypothetical protein
MHSAISEIALGLVMGAPALPDLGACWPDCVIVAVCGRV